MRNDCRKASRNRYRTGLFALAFASAAQAQTYPDRPIRLIAPFPAGGLADVLARAVGDQMTKSLGQPVVVENRAGAGATPARLRSRPPRPTATPC